MKLHELRPAKGATHKVKRIGRGDGSGHGGTSTKGTKGAQARTGYKRKMGHEGGQMPIQRRIPKRGFTNISRKEYALVNLSTLDQFDDGAEITPALLVESGAVSKEKNGIKILGNGQLSKKLTVKASKFSASAVAAIEAAGGKTEVI